MIDSGGIVLDSSIWIEIQRGNQQISKKVIPLIEQNKVSLIDIIVTEVLRGIKSRRDYEKLFDAFLDFEILSTNWLRVAELAFRVAKTGHHPPLADLSLSSKYRRDKHCQYQTKESPNSQQCYWQLLTCLFLPGLQ